MLNDIAMHFSFSNPYHHLYETGIEPQHSTSDICAEQNNTFPPLEGLRELLSDDFFSEKKL